MTNLRVSLVSISLFILHAASLIVTGAGYDHSTNASNLPLRYEIDDFASSGPPFDLFILALAQLQSRNQSDPLSYFQIAGIHGYPQVPWDGVSGYGTYPGFCMHNSVLFPVWHRPYLALFEQVMWTTALTVARQYPLSQRDAYLDAAQNLRIPYWDWASRPGLPSCVMSPTITINTPNGQKQISNPLYQYIFHPGPEGNGIPSSQPLFGLPGTMRYYNASSGQSDNNLANQVLLANAPSTLSLIYSTLTSGENFTLFSTVYPNGHFNGAYNIENVHNNIHVYVGGYNGQMAWPELSAFDPIFWMHHTNVDRLVAMWQAVNPGQYVTPVQNAYGSYYEIPGTIDTEYSGLAPFHADNTTKFHSPDSVRGFAAFGYTYPEFLNVSRLNSTELAAVMRTKINQLYAPPPEQAKRSLSLVDAVKAEDAFSHVSFEAAKSLGVNHCETQWLIEVMIGAGEPHRSYSIDFFMGALPELSRSSTAQNLIASFGQFKLAQSQYGPVASHSNRGGISITHSLLAGVERGYLRDLSVASVVPALQKHLSWRVRSDAGCEINLRSLPGLTITVQSRQVRTREADDQFPVYGPYRVHLEATAGKTGGASGD